MKTHTMYLSGFYDGLRGERPKVCESAYMQGYLDGQQARTTTNAE